MNEILSRIEPEKRDRIINSAFDEFGRNGFEKASTNEIVENAGISKGLLFHYFGSKKHLYDILCEFAVEYSIDILEKKVQYDQRDIFLRIQEITMLKLAALEKYPHIYDFLKKAAEDLSIDEAREPFTQRVTALVERAYCENIDYSLFRPDVDIPKAIEILKWTVEGASAKLIQKKDITVEELVAEHQKYMNLLRQLFYVK